MRPRCLEVFKQRRFLPLGRGVDDEDDLALELLELIGLVSGGSRLEGVKADVGHG